MSEPQVKKTKTVSALDQLKAMTTIVADTGDFEGMPFFICWFHEIFLCMFFGVWITFATIGFPILYNVHVASYTLYTHRFE